MSEGGVSAWEPIRANFNCYRPATYCPGGTHESSPTPQSLRRDRRRWLRKPLAVGRAVVCEGGLARSAWNGWRSATFRSRVIFAIQRVRSAILAL
jgi:hypothetical protein